MFAVGLAAFVQHPLGFYMIRIDECERHLMHVDLGFDGRVLSLIALKDEFVGIITGLHAHVWAVSEHAVMSKRQAILVDEIKRDHFVLSATKESFEHGATSSRHFVRDRSTVFPVLARAPADFPVAA